MEVIPFREMKRCDLMPMKVDPDVQFADGMVRDLGGTVPYRVVSSTAQNRNNHLQWDSIISLD